MGYLKYIELENFKSYKGNIKIGPFKSFTAIIGPNGSGKSNLMDAISFVLGEPTKNLRVKKLSDLIHGAPIGKPVANRASVSFTYSYDDKPNEDSEIDVQETKFTRTIIGSSSEYRIDGKVVNTSEYQAELEKIGIYIKAKNFLVYQGQVESIAMKNAKDITQVFEEISRSIELKDEYERLKSEMNKAEEEKQANFQKKKDVGAQKKEAKQEKEEKEKYEKLKKQLNDLEIKYRLFQLYYNEKAIEETQEDFEKRQDEFKNLERKRDKIEEEIKEKKKEQGGQTREISKLEEQIKDLENKLSKKRPQFIKAKENSTHMFKKFDSAKASYEQALKTHETHENDIKQIESDLQELEEKRSKFEREVEQDALSQGINLELRASQLKTYQQLKEQVAKQNARIKEQLDRLLREQKVDQDALDNESRKKNDSNIKLKQKLYELEDQKVKLNKLNEYIESTERQIQEQQEAETRLSQEIENAKKLCTNLESELVKVQHEIGDARVDKFEQSRTAKKAEIIDQLKKKFPGVYGRLIDHCEPIHRKYQIAITKVMGKSIDAIVVDTEKTARDCIQFMKEQHFVPETFYPLDTIEAPTLDERLREIREPRNTKLLFDVIKFNPPQIRKALLFSVGNCLVCETDDDARNLAFNENGRHKVVSFDGTLFQKSGLISGGSSELKQKAKRWDEKHFDALRRKKDEYTEQFKEQMKISRKEPELADIRSNIKGLEHRLKYSKQNKETAEQRTIAGLEKDIANLKDEMNSFEPKIKVIEKQMNERQSEINKLNVDGNKIEDNIFGDFCKEIGIQNIRVYEERELAGQQEKLKERMKFDEQKTALISQLEFEKSRDTLKSYQKWQKEMQQYENDLKKLKQDEQKLLDEINTLEIQTTELKSQVDKFKVITSNLEEEMNEIKKRLSSHNKEINEFRKKVSSAETKNLDKKSERHRILKQCKLDLIELPMLVGSMDDISEEDQAITQTQQTNTESLVSISTQDANVLYEKEAKLKVDYKKLGREFINLTSQDEIEHNEAKLLNELNDLKETLRNFQMPNYRVDERLDNVREMWENTTSEYEKAQQTAKKARTEFNRVKQERLDRFTKCFEHISGKIDEIYKSLCMNRGAQASLVLENVEEPYLEGIIYNCVAPGKRFRQMDNLSGGEKTVAALALLFAIRSFNPSPFFVLDEVDAALDNTNISKVANFIIEQSSRGLQCIVISLKEEFFHHADALIGVYPEANDCIASKILSLDLTRFNEVE